MLMQLSVDAALANLKSSPDSSWNEPPTPPDPTPAAATRLAEDIFRPVVRPKFRFPRSARIFAMGSCFARNIEKALIERGLDVPHPGTALAATSRQKGTNKSLTPWQAAAYLNKYNTYAMLYEAQRACLGRDKGPEMVIPIAPDHWIDIGAANILADVSQGAVCARREIVDNHSRRMRECDIFVLTLGLTEGWFSRKLGVHINDAAGTFGFVNRTDFEFVVLDFNEQMTALDELYRVIKLVNPGCRFVVTVSPVPLQATFSGQDVVTANTYSKSTLRSVAGAFCATRADADYFPSFEIVLNSAVPVTWDPDRRHVKGTFVAEIMETFVDHYFEPTPQA